MAYNRNISEPDIGTELQAKNLIDENVMQVDIEENDTKTDTAKDLNFHEDVHNISMAGFCTKGKNDSDMDPVRTLISLQNVDNPDCYICYKRTKTLASGKDCDRNNSVGSGGITTERTGKRKDQSGHKKSSKPSVNPATGNLSVMNRDAKQSVSTSKLLGSAGHSSLQKGFPQVVSRSLFEKVSRECASLRKIVKEKDLKVSELTKDIEDLREELATPNPNSGVNAQRSPERDDQGSTSVYIINENPGCVENSMLKQENERLQSEVMNLRRQLGVEERSAGQEPFNTDRVVEPEFHNTDEVYLQEISSLKTKLGKCQKEVEKYKKELNDQRIFMNEVFESSEDQLHRRLQAEVQKNQELRMEADLMRDQLQTFQEDYENLTSQFQKKETQYDVKFSSAQAKIENLRKEIDQKQLSIIRYEGLWQKEKDENMKLRQNLEQQTKTHEKGDQIQQRELSHHESANPTAPGNASHPGSMEIFVCDQCGAQLWTIPEFHRHKSQCK